MEPRMTITALPIETFDLNQLKSTYKLIVALDSDTSIDELPINPAVEQAYLCRIDDVFRFVKDGPEKVINHHVANSIVSLSIDGQSKHTIILYTNEQVGMAIKHGLEWLWNNVSPPQSGYNLKVYELIAQQKQFRTTFNPNYKHPKHQR